MLGPLLFTIYMLPLGDIICFHSYAELYLSTKVFTQLLLQSLQPLLKLNDPNLEDQRSTR